jgi:hypothetical protein
MYCTARAYAPYRDAIKLYANTFDADSGIQYVEYWDGLPGGPGSTLIGISYDAGNAFLCTWATDPGGTNDGLHYIYARAYDRAGNALTSSAIEVQVDSQAPLGPNTTPIWISIIIGCIAIAGAILGHGILRRTRVSPEPALKKGIFVEKSPKGA